MKKTAFYSKEAATRRREEPEEIKKIL